MRTRGGKAVRWGLRGESRAKDERFQGDEAGADGPGICGTLRVRAGAALIVGGVKRGSYFTAAVSSPGIAMR